LSDDLTGLSSNITDSGRLAYFIASSLNTLATPVKQGILETLDVRSRLENLHRLLIKELEVLEIGSKIQSQVQSEVGKNQREYFLREQLKAIQKELGDEDDDTRELDELAEKIDAAGMPDDVKKEALRELDRLERMPPAAAEYTVSRTYIDWLVTLPWTKRSEETIDLVRTQQVLDAEHSGLEKAKDRILEYLAVRKLNPSVKGPILCFVGPPGVGKTSLARSIATSLGREFVRVSLGGMRDEAEIRGHRRTYVGSLPGQIIQGLRRAGARNPVFILDEIDKLGTDFRGDPASALLEVLDPEQNHAFSDHYLDVPFDLSKVMFLATANVLSQIPEPLRDRMEVLEIPGYLLEEKVQIALRHILPKQLERHGLQKKNLSVPAAVMKRIVQEHTREAGVRGLDRVVQRLCRKAALDVAKGGPGPKQLSPQEAEKMLGKQKHRPDERRTQRIPGVVQGLAWTPFGGDVLYVEVTGSKGKGGLQTTGSLGDVMSESARLALSYLKSRADAFGIDLAAVAETDLHLHFPAGAIPKDGPSAGITIATAMLSFLTRRAANMDLAMTGELTVVGEVLPIGGVREKVLAAKNFGLKRVLLPQGNEAEAKELKPELVEGITIHFAERFEQVFDLVFGGAGRGKPAKRPAR
jgi:ATP-dependent Lon protease